MKYTGRTNEYLEVSQLGLSDTRAIEDIETDQLVVIWFEEDGGVFNVDGKSYTFSKNDIICLTGFHQVRLQKLAKAKFIKFNSPFYCILDHDSEVGCKGILFFGSKRLPWLKQTEKDIEILEAVWKMLLLEMEAIDNLQLEMLQMMLKRILILCTRIYKNQEDFDQLDHSQTNLVREFNYLVEMHFKEKRTVAEYAELLHKSPKTLSNVFKKLGNESPLQIIQSRLMLEGRRLLSYTDTPVSELADLLGFNDIQSFSRFFKKNEGMSPSEFRSNLALGK